jgi:hypothetical protein
LVGLHDWWSGLSGESKAAIIAAIVGPIVAAILGIRVRMIRRVYIRILGKLDAAREELKKDPGPWKQGGIITLDDGSSFPISVERAAKKAKVWLWLAKRATRWHEEGKKYGF